MTTDDVLLRGASRATPQQRFMTGVYQWMAAALAVTGAAAWYAASSPTFMRLLYGNAFMLIGLCIAEIGLVCYLSARIRTLSANAAIGLFFAYALLNGLTMSSIFMRYTASSIGTVFFYAAAMFGGMSVYGSITKADLTKVGNLLGMALWGVIIAIVVSFFLRSGTFSYLISLAAVVFFTGLTAYDTQKLRSVVASADAGTATKQSIFGALQLYLDFVNLFMALLRIFGKRR